MGTTDDVSSSMSSDEIIDVTGLLEKLEGSLTLVSSLDGDFVRVGSMVVAASVFLSVTDTEKKWDKGLRFLH